MSLNQKEKLTQSREAAEISQSFSLRNLCGSASLRESFCFFVSNEAPRNEPQILQNPI
jgi:hypothetical protein